MLKLETVLYSSKAEEEEPTILQDNYRATQPLNHRTVLSSFIPGRKEREIMKKGGEERIWLWVRVYVTIQYDYMLGELYETDAMALKKVI